MLIFYKNKDGREFHILKTDPQQLEESVKSGVFKIIIFDEFEDLKERINNEFDKDTARRIISVLDEYFEHGIVFELNTEEASYISIVLKHAVETDATIMWDMYSSIIFSIINKKDEEDEKRYFH